MPVVSEFASRAGQYVRTLVGLSAGEAQTWTFGQLLVLSMCEGWVSGGHGPGVNEMHPGIIALQLH